MDMSQNCYAKGLELEMAGDYASAANEFEEAINAGFVNSEVYRRLGICLSEVERYKEAISAIRKSIEIDPMNSLSHADLGFVYQKLGMRHEAAREYERALELAPELMDFYLQLIDTYRLLKRTDEAQALVEQALKIDKMDARVYWLHGQICLEQGRILECQNAWQRTQELAAEDNLREVSLKALVELQARIAPSTIEQRAAAEAALSRIARTNENKQSKTVIADLEKVCLLDPFFIAARLELAQAYLDAGRERDAIKVFAGIVQEQPENQEALLGSGRALVEMGLLSDAMDVLNKTNEINPMSDAGKVARRHLTMLDVRNRYGVIPTERFEDAISQYQMGNLKKAIELMTEAISLAPDIGLFHYELGWMYLFSTPDKLNSAVRHFRMSIEADSREGRFYGGLGTALIQQDKLQEAVPVLTQAILLDPNNPESRNALAMCYIASNELDLAEIELQKITELDPYRREGWTNLYDLLVRQGKFGQASVELERLLEAVPDAEFAKEAEQLLSTFLETQESLLRNKEQLPTIPEEASARLTQTTARLCQEGRSLEIAGYIDLAIERYQTAISENFESFDPHYLLGNAYAHARQPHEAIKEYTFAVSMQASEKEIADAYYNMGNCYRDLNKIDQAIPSYRKAVEVYPSIHGARGNIGACLADQGKYEEAIEMVRNEMNILSKAGTPYAGHLNFILGQLLMFTDKYEDALFEFKKAMTVGMNLGMIHELMGEIFGSKGLWNLAEAEFEKALEIEPVSGVARTAVRATRFVEYEVPWLLAEDEPRVKHSLNYRSEQIRESYPPITERIDFVYQEDGKYVKRRKTLGSDTD